jgi:hypothetical protein
MSIYAASDLQVEISNGTLPRSFSHIQGIERHRWRVTQEMIEDTGVREDAWQRQSAPHMRQVTLALELVATSHPAQRMLREAALMGTKPYCRITHPEGLVMEGNFHVAEYEEDAEEDALLAIAVELISDATLNLL